MKCNINEFSFAQMCSNSKDGKTSGSGTMAILFGIVGSIGFLAGVFTKNTEILSSSIIVIGTSAGLLGYRKSQDKESSITATVDAPIPVADPVAPAPVIVPTPPPPADDDNDPRHQQLNS